MSVVKSANSANPAWDHPRTNLNYILVKRRLRWISKQRYNIFPPIPNFHRVERRVEWGIERGVGPRQWILPEPMRISWIDSSSAHSPRRTVATPFPVVLYIGSALMIHLQGRSSCPPGRSTGRVSVALVCFEGFPLCQSQDPTEEDLPFGLWGRWEVQPLTSTQSTNGKGRKPLALTTGFYWFWS